MSRDLEVWQRGPIAGIQPLLQPVAHALLQVAEELEDKITDLADELLWQRPAGVASVGFHLKHITGVVDRLFTYARSETLTPRQLEYLHGEGEPDELTSARLIHAFRLQVDVALQQLRETPPDALSQPRGIGRKQIPTTVIGLLFHAAEHCERHLGQLLVTARIAQAAASAK